MPELFGDRLFTALEQSDLEPGTLMVAAPNIQEEAARRRVLLTCLVDQDVVGGLILDERTDVPIKNVLPELVPLSSDPKVLFHGGSANTDTILSVAVMKPGMTAEDLWEAGLAAREIFTGVVLIQDLARITYYEPYIEDLRVFRGMVFEPRSEVEARIKAGDWYVIPALPSDVVSSEKVGLWQTVMRRQPMPLSLFSTYPAHPINN